MREDELCARLENLNRVPLGHLPTPLEPLSRLTEVLKGPELWVKRDDQTGLAMGGNKVRKLEFLMADALVQQADVVMTAGAPQSNHARQTAAAAAHLGVPCVLVLHGQPPAEVPQGNYFLDRLLGADVRWSGARPMARALEEEAETLRAEGRRPYVIPYGGSNAVGVCGYVAAMAELWRQMRDTGVTFDAVVVASSSGGTQAGLALGARTLGYGGSIVGISIAEHAEPFKEHISALAGGGGTLLGLEDAVKPDDVVVLDAYLGGGYAVMGMLEREAIAMAARSEGLLVDPVYTGRALGGLIDQIHSGTFSYGERVLFWHTGGTPALFAYAEEVGP